MRRGHYSRVPVNNMEGRYMEYSGGPWERVGESASAAEALGRHSGIQSVQNLEAVINEGLRVALLEEDRISPIL